MEHRKKQMKECQTYFKERKVFDKVFRGFCKKYESLGHIGGTVVLKNLSQEEKEQLGGFLGKDCFGRQQISVSSRLFEDALAKSRFSVFSLQEILEAYIGSPLMAKKEKKERKEKEKEIFFEKLVQLAENLSVKDWIQKCIEERNSEFKYMEREWSVEPERLWQAVQMVCSAGDNLPYLTKNYELLPVFAARLTKNPHAFDHGTMAHYLLTSYLQFLFPKPSEDGVSDTERLWTLFYQAGILKDDLSNSVLLYGFHGILASEELHSGIEGFLKQKEPLQLTLLSLGSLKKIYSENKNIYMVENPAVFSYLCKKYPEGSFICGNGQQRMSVWVFISKLDGEQNIFYAGDFDPEGVGIAERLKRRFPDRIRLWKYETDLYQKYLSSHEISEQRLKKLDRIELPELQELCDCMREKRAAAYQESMLEEYQVK